MNYTFPFTAIVGMDLVKRSLLYHAIDPRLGGLLLMGHRGCAKSTVARAFREILPPPENVEEAPFVEVPLGTTEDRLLGSIDASRLLENGEWTAQTGLIQQADSGVLTSTKSICCLIIWWIRFLILPPADSTALNVMVFPKLSAPAIF